MTQTLEASVKSLSIVERATFCRERFTAVIGKYSRCGLFAESPKEYVFESTAFPGMVALHLTVEAVLEAIAESRRLLCLGEYFPLRPFPLMH